MNEQKILFLQNAWLDTINDIFSCCTRICFDLDLIFLGISGTCQIFNNRMDNYDGKKNKFIAMIFNFISPNLSDFIWRLDVGLYDWFIFLILNRSPLRCFRIRFMGDYKINVVIQYSVTLITS